MPLEGDVDVVFALYATETGGTPFHSETQTVSVDSGRFTTYLGDATPLELAEFAARSIVFLGMTVGSDDEMTPRLQLATAPYAAFAQMCGDAQLLDGSAASDFAAADHEHAYSDLTGSLPSHGHTYSDISGSLPSHSHAYSDLTGSLPSHTHAWSQLTSIPAGFADGVDNEQSQSTVEGWARGVCYDTEGELTASLNDNYFPAAGGTMSGNLTVNGGTGVTATNFRYSSPLTGVISISGFGCEFDPSSSTSGIQMRQDTSNSRAYIVGTGTGMVANTFCSVPLPHGVTVTDLECTMLNNDADRTDGVIAQLLRHPVRGGAPGVMATLQLTARSTSPATSSTSSISSALVDNFTYAYRIYYGWSETRTTSTPERAFYGCVLRYTSPGPG